MFTLNNGNGFGVNKYIYYYIYITNTAVDKA